MPKREQEQPHSEWRREKLPGGGVAYVTDAHRFQTDGLYLAAFARPQNRERICDLGTGCGSIPLIWYSQGLSPQVDGIDIQPGAVWLAAASARENGWDDRFRLRREDWRHLSLEAGAYDRVICNPPYFAAGTGKISQRLDREQIRHEDPKEGMAGWIGAAYRLLRTGGRLCVCHRPERLVDLVTALRQAGLEPKRLRWVQRRADTRPWLLLCEARKGGHPGLQTEPVWIEETERLEKERGTLCPDI